MQLNKMRKQNQKISTEILTEIRGQNWFAFMKAVMQEIPDLKVDQIIVLEGRWHYSETPPPDARPALYELTFGEICYNAMLEIKEYFPTEADFNTFQRMNRLAFSTGQDMQKDINALEKKIGFFA